MASDISLRIITQFFDRFEMEAVEQMNLLAMKILEVEELACMFTSVASFASTARNELFMNILACSCDEKDVIEQFSIFYTVALSAPFQQVLQSNRHLTAFINKYTSDIKDVIFISIDKGLEAIKSRPACQGPVAKRGISIRSFEDEEDEISIEIAKEQEPPVQKIEVEELLLSRGQDEDEDENNSSSPRIITDFEIKASCRLIYGIEPSHCLFPIATYFLKFIMQNKLKSYDPIQLLYSNPSTEVSYYFGFSVASPIFQEFCRYTNNSVMPITSPLYRGPRRTNAEKLIAKREIIVNLARQDAFEIDRILNVQEIIAYVLLKDNSIDGDIVEFIIGIIREKINEYLSALDVKGSFIAGFESAIKEGYLFGKEMFCLSEDEILSKTIFDAFISLFQAPMAFLKKSDSVEVWKSIYDESSPTFKFNTELSPISDVTDSLSRSSGRKSVTIQEGRNQTNLLPNDDVFSPIDDENFGKPLRRTSSFSKCLNLCDSCPIPTSPDLSKFFDVQFDAPQSVSKEVIQFSKNEAPDFPFENPVAAIEDPAFIEAVGIYASENGHGPCFLLDEYSYSIDEGMTFFLRENFRNSEAIESVGSLFAESFNAILKP